MHNIQKKTCIFERYGQCGSWRSLRHMLAQFAKADFLKPFIPWNEFWIFFQSPSQSYQSYCYRGLPVLTCVSVYFVVPQEARSVVTQRLALNFYFLLYRRERLGMSAGSWGMQIRFCVDINVNRRTIKEIIMKTSEVMLPSGWNHSSSPQQRYNHILYIRHSDHISRVWGSINIKITRF